MIMKRQAILRTPLLSLLFFPFSLISAFQHHLPPLLSTRRTCLITPKPATSTHGALQAVSRLPEPLSSSSSSIESSPKQQEEEEEVTFPPPLSTVQRLQRAVTFWSSALPIVASYYQLQTQLSLGHALRGENPKDTTEQQAQEEELLWDQAHAKGAETLAATVADLQGFYVKTAQIISSRRDLFPEAYTEALSGFTDNADPLPVSLIKAVIRQELLHSHEEWDDVFSEFDEVPLGAASVAQVHRARLSKKYGNKQVAVKVQRPSIESKLMGDIANLKTLAKTFRNNPSLPLDYYTVFCELETQLAAEFDFVAEAAAMDRIYQSLIRSPIDGRPRDLPLVIPRPVSGLITKRVLVMDFLPGVPLSRARDEMEKKGIDPDSAEAKLFGRNLLQALTTVFGRTILETGFFHADPHPGNIFVLPDGSIGLIDYGQVKQISGRARETLAKVMVALDERRDDEPDDQKLVGDLALELGVVLNKDAQQEAAAAVGIWLFDGTVEHLPGGYDKGELSPNSPVRELKSFPQDLVLVGRSSILIKGLSDRLGIPWSLAKEWAPIAREVLDQQYAANGYTQSNEDAVANNNRVRFREVVQTAKLWSQGQGGRVTRALPSPVRSRLAKVVLARDERKRRKENFTKKR